MSKRNILKSLSLSIALALATPFVSNVCVKNVYASESKPSIVSEAAIVLNYDTGEIVYEKNANQKMYLASTSKLMTAILFAENKEKTDTLTYSEDAKAQPPYTIDSEQMKPYGKSMSVGDTLDADTVMKELLLFSGNDAAYMVADNVCKTTDEFVEKMNSKAKDLGLTNTHFENPNGLPENGHDVNYSTAYELALITKEAYKNDWIKKTMALDKAQVTLPGNTNVTIENRNTELGKNGNLGGKTGVTDEAGTCFAGIYERDGKKYIGVILKCDRNDNNKRFEDLDSMMDYSESADKVTVIKSGKKVSSVNLEYKLFRFFGPTKTIKADVVLGEDVKLYDNEINNSEVKVTFNTKDTNAWTVASDNNTNLTAKVKQFSTKVKGEVKITTLEIVKANIGVYIATLVAIVIIITLIVFIIKLIGNAKRNSSRKKRRRY